MRIPRIFHPHKLQIHDVVRLSEDAAHHVSRVLRMAGGQTLLLFNGTNLTYNAEIIVVDRKKVTVRILSGQTESCESPLRLHLGQVISRGEKMEFTIQKSIELGVNVITPLFSSRCGVKLEESRLAKKRQQWQKIAIAACEQCGRNIVPEIRETMPLENWLAEDDDSLKLNLHPRAGYRINRLAPSTTRIRLLIGPEGGLSPEEIVMSAQHGFIGIQLGPRILRTETSALTAITALQIRFGDLG